MKDKFFGYLQNLQDEICAALEKADGEAKFQQDLWERPEGGGGRTRVMANGKHIEKAGVNISAVHGKIPDALKNKMGTHGENFFACGLSLVIHPENPFAPTTHANYRYFEMYDEENNLIDSWFGGGADLTPYYLFEEDAVHFHQVQKDFADPHGEDLYPKFKIACDEYFRNTHRNEARGIGGTFYDYLKADSTRTIEDWGSYNMSMGKSFVPSFIPVLNKRKNMPYGDKEKYWQEIRRGRYAEFNLVHDRGTLFGLKTNGRIESILMSLPPTVRWDYEFPVEEGSAEAKLVEILTNPVDWIK